MAKHSPECMYHHSGLFADSVCTCTEKCKACVATVTSLDVSHSRTYKDPHTSCKRRHVWYEITRMDDVIMNIETCTDKGRSDLSRKASMFGWKMVQLERKPDGKGKESTGVS